MRKARPARPRRVLLRLARPTLAASLAVALALAGGCGDGSDDGGEDVSERSAPMTIQLASSAFDPGTIIPARFTGDGEDLSPQLEWSGLPPGTAELALIVDDPDAPRAEPWVHWLLYGIPATAAGLAEGISGDPAGLQVAGGLREGKNDFGRPGYGGPAPPRGHGVHHYQFRLYALDAPLILEAGATKSELLRAMSGHVLAEGLLVGTYER